MIKIQNISKFYRKGEHVIRALDNVSLQLSPGEFVSVYGPSGCGKTTLLLIAGGLLLPNEGKVLLDNEDVYELNADGRAAFRAACVGFVFQQFHLIPYLTVLDNIRVSSMACQGRESKRRAEQLAQEFNLGHRLSHLPAELSTGEKQRVAMARALLNEPKVLLADEPTGNLDDSNAEVLLSHLGRFAKAGGGVLLVTHDRLVSEHAHRSLHLANGRFQEA